MQPKRSDSLKTQALIISTAERLLSERGIDGVSLSEINRAAGQRTKSALHYHFGSRDGLLKAILEKHRRTIDERRTSMIAEFDGREPTFHEAVGLLVRPLATLLDDDGGGGVHYIRIMAQLASTPQHPLNAWLFNERPASFALFAPVIYRGIPRCPTLLRVRRIHLMNGTMFHSLLLQTEASPEASTPHHRALYVNDLVDCLCGLLGAPISDPSGDAIRSAAAAGVAEPATDDAIPRL